jgi:hypothetical protein
MRERIKPIPIVPVFVNCFYPPNQPTAARCYELGRAIRRAIAAYGDDITVGIVASGGLSHFVVDEAFDRSVLRALESKNIAELKALSAERLVSGTSELRNWLVLAGAVEDCDIEVLDYVPAYRSTAKTGCGMGFVRWTAPRLPAENANAVERTAVLSSGQ